MCHDRIGLFVDAEFWYGSFMVVHFALVEKTKNLMSASIFKDAENAIDEQGYKL